MKIEIKNQRLYLNGRAVDRWWFDGEANSEPAPMIPDTDRITVKVRGEQFGAVVDPDRDNPGSKDDIVTVTVHGESWGPKSKTNKNVLFGSVVSGGSVVIGDQNIKI